MLVITIGMTIQAIFLPERAEEVAEEAANVEEIYLQPEAYSKLPSNLAWGTDLPGSLIALETPAASSPFVYETDIFLITFDPRGASISSFKLKKHLDKGEPVELLFGDANANNAFLMYAGSDRTRPIDAPFNYKVVGNQVIFSQTFAIKGEDVPFTLTKTYTFGEASISSKST